MSLDKVLKGHVKVNVVDTGAPKVAGVGFENDKPDTDVGFVALVPSITKISLNIFSYLMFEPGKWYAILTSNFLVASPAVNWGNIISSRDIQ